MQCLVEVRLVEVLHPKLTPLLKGKAFCFVMKKTPEKKEKLSSDNSNHYRFFTYGTNEGVSIAKGKMPILENREPYLWPFFNFLMADKDYKKHLCVNNFVPVCAHPIILTKL
jgi:hypothetical protein